MVTEPLLIKRLIKPGECGGYEGVGTLGCSAVSLAATQPIIQGICDYLCSAEDIRVESMAIHVKKQKMRRFKMMFGPVAAMLI